MSSPFSADSVSIKSRVYTLYQFGNFPTRYNTHTETIAPMLLYDLPVLLG